jgi:hypothetical protein
MGARLEIHQQFVDRFHFGELPRPVTDSELDGVEIALHTVLPSSFRTFMMRFGAVYTPGILDAICNKGLDHPDVQDVLTPDESIENTKGYWSAGMPADVIGVASDCMGNMFGFRRCRQRCDDLPIVFFDHDFNETSKVSESFDAFLEWYLSHI